MFITTIFQVLGALSWIWVPALIIWLIYANRKPRTPNLTIQNQARDGEWRNYLQSFRGVVKDKHEVALLEALIRGDTGEQYSGQPAPTEIVTNKLASLALAEVGVSNSLQLEEPLVLEELRPAKPQIDSTLLLLYFGAFLLVASIGLFVALSSVSGVGRTIIVAITAAALYSGGLWLYEHNQKLAQAGISFVGCGLIVAPLTGVAWYNLVANKAGGAVIWFITSLVCGALYAYSYRRLKNDFVAYLLIGSFVSVVESSVLTLGIPTYGYAWGLAIVGIILQLLRRRRPVGPKLEQATATSAELLTPLAIIGSAVLLPHSGSLQLAVTLVLSGTYYALFAMQPNSANRFNYSLGAQLSYVAALGNIVYASQHSLTAVGLSLAVAGVVYAALIATLKKQLTADFGLMEIGLAVVAIAALCCLGDGWSLSASLVAALVLTVVIWQKMARDDAMQAAGIILILLPFVIVQYAMGADLHSYYQLALSGAAALILGCLVWDSCADKQYKSNYASASGLYWVALATTLIPAIAIGGVAVVSLVAVALASCVLLRRASHDQMWLTGSSLIVFIPVVYLAIKAGADSQQFSLAVIATLAWNAALSLITREALSRWLVVISLLLMPFALGGGGLGWHWGAFGYSLGYLASTLACLLARAIARGKLLVSFKVPIASYYTEASQAYVVGYVVAGLTSLGLSLNSDQSHWLTTSLLAVAALIVVAVMRIEKESRVLALLPVILQLFIFSGLRPSVDNSMQIGLTGLLLTAAAVASYAAPYYLHSRQPDADQGVRQVSLFLSYAGAALAVLSQATPSPLLAVSLLIAGGLTAYHNWQRSQPEREVSIGVCLLAMHWFLYLSGVHNLQIHTHLLGAFLAGFAVWRHRLGDRAGSQGYQLALFLAITVPLAVQSLSSEAGSTYGLILIAEQVGFMIIGATLPTDEKGQHLLLRLGLWTGLGAVLFQLRGLGYAFLSLLAFIIIGVAVYRLQKAPHDKL